MGWCQKWRDGGLHRYLPTFAVLAEQHYTLFYFKFFLKTTVLFEQIEAAIGANPNQKMLCLWGRETANSGSFF